MADVYCFICGANAEVADALEADLHELAFEGRRVSPHPSTLRHFLFSDSDIRFQRDLSLVGPFAEDGSELWDPSSDDWDALRRLPASSARLLRDMSPGTRHDFAEVHHGPSGRQYWITGNSHIFGHTGCFDILSRVMRSHRPAEDAWVPAFWAAVRKVNFSNTAANGIDSVNYGWLIERTKHIDVVPLANMLVADGGIPERLVRALESDVLHEAAHADYWLGRGQMWIFVRPDDFPVMQARASTFELQNLAPEWPSSRTKLCSLESLPVELLCETAKYLPSAADVGSLLITSKTLRSSLVPSISILARHHLPHCWLPDSNTVDPGPFRFPWLRYARECRVNSPSMRNRRRIFATCDQIASLAAQLTPDDMNGTAVYEQPQFNVAVLEMLFPKPTAMSLMEPAEADESMMDEDDEDAQQTPAFQEQLVYSAHTVCAVL